MKGSNAFLVDYLRTPISRARPREPDRDWLNKVRSDMLAGQLIKELIKRNPIDPHLIDHCIIGCANQTGEQFTYGGRVVSFLGDLPHEVPAMGVEKQCVSSMMAVQIGSMEIMTDYSDVVMVGGMEHMTHIPMRYGLNLNKELLKEGKTESKFDVSKAGKTVEDMYEEDQERYNAPSMGDTAEILFQESHITKEEIDRWSLRSHQKAVQAQEEGFFDDEILPIEVGEEIIDKDQSVRPDTSYEAINSLPPAFKKDGVITAGNSSPLNSGASMALLMSEEKMEEYGLDPMTRIVSMGKSGVDPMVMGKGPAPASRDALENVGLEVEDIDFWEINEAFSIVALWNILELGIDTDRPYTEYSAPNVNAKGGAVALGHPLGMTGTRLVGTLARILEWEGGRYGLATACVGGGQGAAVIIEKE